MIGEVTQTLEYRSEIYNSQLDGDLTNFLSQFANEGWQIIHVTDIKQFELDSITRFIFQRITQKVSGVIQNERSNLAIH